MIFVPRRFAGVFLAVAVALVAADGRAGAAGAPEVIRVAPLGRPKLIFACDRPTPELGALLTPAVVKELADLHAGVALSTEDFSPERAAIVDRLTRAGVPLTAWLVLPRAEGYYVNAGNAAATAAQFDVFDRWSRQHHLHWEAVGLDIEPSLTEFAAFGQHRFRLIAHLIRRALDGERVVRARSDYAALIGRMQARGYRVQTYQLPFIVDEREARTTLLERLLGLVNVRGDEEVLMLYSSFDPAAGAGIVRAYGPRAQMIAVGSTTSSGDPATDARMPPLSWAQFSRDLVVAAHFTRVVGVYSLEGCVERGFLARLETMDWRAPVAVPAAAIVRAAAFRRHVQTALWVGSRLPYLAAGLLVLAGATIGMFVRWRRRRRAAAPAADSGRPQYG